MALLQIPFDRTRGNQLTRVELEGVLYGLKFLWNSRLNSWTLEVQSADGTPIVSGVHVVADYSLLSHYTSQNLFSGRLFCLDMDNSQGTPNADTLGVNYQFFYQESTDF
jgi:hypothetical protein